MIDDGLQILVVDDEAHIRTGLAKGLSGEEIVVDTAKDGVEALEKFRRDEHQLVITDVRLPGNVDGLDVLRSIHEARPETLVIVITAYGTIETAVEAMRCGAYDFVTKPVDLKIIRHQVRKASEHRRLVLENRQLRERLGLVGEDLEIVGNSRATQDLLREIRPRPAPGPCAASARRPKGAGGSPQVSVPVLPSDASAGPENGAGSERGRR